MLAPDNKFAMIPNDSSLARFLHNHGFVMAGGNQARNGAIAQVVVGIGLILLACTFGIVGILNHSGIKHAFIGPFIGGAINLGIGVAMLRKFGVTGQDSAQLTPQARSVLRQLIVQLMGGRTPVMMGWNGNPQMQKFYGHQYSVMSSWRTGTSPQIPVALLGLLEQICVQYNRLDALSQAHRNETSELGKLSPRLKLAADEGMAEALHHAAMINQFPEGSAPSRMRVEAIIRSLQETADRSEALSLRQPSITDRLSYRSAVEDVLDELRNTQSAHEELQREVDRSQN